MWSSRHTATSFMTADVGCVGALGPLKGDALIPPRSQQTKSADLKSPGKNISLCQVHVQRRSSRCDPLPFQVRRKVSKTDWEAVGEKKTKVLVMREEARGTALCSGAPRCQIYLEIQLILPLKTYQVRHQPGLWHET